MPLSAGRLDDFCPACNRAVENLDTHECTKWKRNVSSRGPAPRTVSKTDLARIDTSAARQTAPRSDEQAVAGAGPRQPATESSGRSGIPSRFGRSWAEHVEAWHAAGRLAEQALWTRAAVAYSLRETFKAEGVAKFAEEIGQTTARVYGLAQVFERFPAESNRFDSLSFTHHQLAAATPDPAATLTRAQEEGWSVPAMRAALSAPRPAPAPKDDRAASLVSAAEERQQGQTAPPADLGGLARHILAHLTRAEISRLVAILSGGVATDERQPEEP